MKTHTQEQLDSITEIRNTKGDPICTKLEQLECDFKNMEVETLNKFSISQVNLRKDMNEYGNKIQELNEKIKLLNESIESYKQNKSFSSQTTRNLDTPVINQSSTNNRDILMGNQEILMCFDSNGKYLDRKKLWKVEKSLFTRCSTLFNISQVIKELNVKEIKYVLISVGCNDLDEKDHSQVLDEMKSLIKQIKEKFQELNSSLMK